MCECWEFSCGHTTEIPCRGYMNRSLTEIDKETIDDDDPFTDAGAHLSTAKDRNRLSRVHSDSNPNRPPPFILPSPTLSSVTSETDRASSASSIRPSSNSTSRNCGPGPAVKNTDSSIAPVLPAPPTNKISGCCGPSERTRQKADDQCYHCILQKAKDNSTFQQNERDAETRLYDEIERQANHPGGRDRHPVMREVTNNNNNNGQPSARHMPGNPAYVNNAIDIGRGDQPRGGGRRHGPATPTLTNRDSQNDHRLLGPNIATAAPPIPQAHFQPQAHDQFFDQTYYQGPGPPMAMSMPLFNPNTPYSSQGPPAQYAPQNIQYQQPPDVLFQQPPTPYGYACETLQPQQYMYPPLEMGMPYQGLGEALHEQYQYDYQQMMRAGYGYFPRM